MTISLINLGNVANDGSGETLRSAMQKINDNFTYITNNISDDTEVVNLGTTGEGLFYQETNNQLQFKKIAAGLNITLTADNEKITIATPSTLTANLTGNVTGNVTGNLTGNVTGNTTGTHTGSVVGNVTGNADTVTNGVYTTSSINVLADVDTATTPPTNGQGLIWSAAQSKWIPSNIVSGGGAGVDFGTITSPSPLIWDFGSI
jgi:hypothetical protein